MFYILNLLDCTTIYNLYRLYDYIVAKYIWKVIAKKTFLTQSIIYHFTYGIQTSIRRNTLVPPI
jgi:hypothetical protein